MIRSNGRRLGRNAWLALALILGLGTLVGIAVVQPVAQLVSGESGSYTSYRSVTELLQSAAVGDRVTVPLQVDDFTDSQYRYEGDRQGLIVSPPATGFKRGEHQYYLQIVAREDHLTQAAIFGTGAQAHETKPFLMARVIKLE